MVLKAAIRACRRVFWEYQGQLLWKATSFGRAMLDEGNNDDTWADFDAEARLPTLPPGGNEKSRPSVLFSILLMFFTVKRTFNRKQEGLSVVYVRDEACS